MAVSLALLAIANILPFGILQTGAVPWIAFAAGLATLGLSIWPTHATTPFARKEADHAEKRI